MRAVRGPKTEGVVFYIVIKSRRLRGVYLVPGRGLAFFSRDERTPTRTEPAHFSKQRRDAHFPAQTKNALRQIFKTKISRKQRRRPGRACGAEMSQGNPKCHEQKPASRPQKTTPKPAISGKHISSGQRIDQKTTSENHPYKKSDPCAGRSSGGNHVNQKCM